AALTGAALTGAVLTGAVLTGADLTGAAFAPGFCFDSRSLRCFSLDFTTRIACEFMSQPSAFMISAISMGILSG
ncbi:MAG: pentapeptide repeat-containing protein, partial [Planctomycetaceae bacterium]